MLNDITMLPIAKEQFNAELRSLDIGWVGNSSKEENQKSEGLSGRSLPLPNQMAPLYLDEAVDVSAFAGASAIEFQLYGLPFQSLPSSRKAKWTPGLPIEIFDYEQLATKVECIRMLTQGRCVIGAAISPGNVYDDVRFIVDSGFDYISLLVDVRYDWGASGFHSLAPLWQTVDRAMKGISDSGSKIKVLVAAQLTNVEDMFRCLQLGVAAVTVDGYLANLKPIEQPQPKDTYSSVLSYVVPQVSPFAWVKPAVTNLIVGLRDCRTYAG